MTIKEQVIDWLVANEATTLEIVAKTNERLLDVPDCFKDEARDQWHSLVRDEIVDQITRAHGIPCEDVYGELEGCLRLYLDHVLTNESNSEIIR